MDKIFVTVSGGSAYVMEDTVPKGFDVEIIDFDNIEAGDSFPSEQAREYCKERNLYEAPRAPRR
jgi:spore coat polysaccharide biosynthesis protein SpsF (cytidylyltransferase family)